MRVAGTTYARFRLSTAGGPGRRRRGGRRRSGGLPGDDRQPAAASGVFGGQNTISTAANGAVSVFAADMDGDGDLDVLVRVRL